MRQLCLFIIVCVIVAVMALVLNFLTSGMLPWAGSPVSSSISEYTPAKTPVFATAPTGSGTSLLPPYGTTTPSLSASPSRTPVTLPLAADTVSAADNPYTISTTALEQRVHDLINQQRTANGLAVLRFDGALADIARHHSEDMAVQDYFAHMNPAGQDPTARGIAAGYTCRKDYGSYYYFGIAENLFQNNLYSSATYFSNRETVYTWNPPEAIAQTTVGGWMNRSGHRKNILTPTFDREGIGIAIASDDKVYITENFC
ncbi:MAG: CAP domain-containing protein [Methanoregula sp.]